MMPGTCKHGLDATQCAWCRNAEDHVGRPETTTAFGEIGIARVREVEGARTVFGKTVAKRDSTGLASIWRLTLENAATIELAVVEWADLSREVKPVTADGDHRLRMLERRRITIMAHPSGRYVVLNQLRTDPKRPHALPTKYAATFGELDAGARVDTVAVLKAHGATRVGPNERVSGETGRSRSLSAAMFPPDNAAVPVAAWVITRALPLFWGVTT